MKKLKNLFYLFTPLILGGITSIIIKDKIDYIYLIRPPFSPPAFLFGIAWTILYFLMGLSFYLYKKNMQDKNIDRIYYSQLILNILWPIVFFVLKFRFIATVWIIFLTLVVALMLYKLARSYKISFYINIPYIMWLIYATYLTFSIYLLNE